MSLIHFYYYYFSSIYAGYPWVVKMAVFIVMLLLILSLLGLFRFLFLRHKQRKEARRIRKIEKRYKDQFVELLYFTFREVRPQELEDDEDLKMVTKSWEKEMTTDLLLELKDDKSYERDGGIFNYENFFHLLRYFRLLDFWMSQASAGSTGKVLKALRIVNEIGEGVRGSTFSRSLYHNHDYLRKFSRTSFTRFDSNDPFQFLEDGFDKSFNKFDETRIHYTLVEIAKDRSIPPLSKWVRNSKFESYRIFLIKEIGLFDQQDAIPYLIELFHETESLGIQCQISKTLGQLKYEEALDLFGNEFPYSTQLLQASMIEGVGKLDSKKALPFLQEAYHISQYNDIKIRIVEVIQSYREEGMAVLIALSGKSSNDFEENLFDYALNQ